MSRAHEAFSGGPTQDGIEIVNPLEVPDWDESIARFPAAGIFHSSSWARVLHETYGYGPCYLVQRESGAMQSALPLMDVASWLTGRRGVSLPFTDAVEPLAADQASFQRLFGAAQKFGESRAWKYLECRGGRQWLPDAPASTAFHNHRLPLVPDAAKLFATFEESVQRAIRKSGRSNLQIEFSRNLESVRAFYRLLGQTRQRHGVPPQPFRFFANIQRHILGKNLGWVVLARIGNTPVAGAVFFHFGREAIYKFGASDLAFQDRRANNLVMWEAIQRLASAGLTTLDFGRTSLGNAGLRRFKLGWGTREHLVEYVRYDFAEKSFGTSRDESSGWYNRVFNAMPQWAARPIGALLYPHIG